MISLGPDVVQETLRKALSMGADRAVQLKADRGAVGRTRHRAALAAELKDGGYDLILFGRQAIDSANATVGPMTAELLGLPCVDGGVDARHCERTGDRAPRARGCGGDRRVRAARGRERRRGDAARALSVAQGHHGGEEEAARGEARAARRRSAFSIEKMELPPERAAGRIVGEGPDAVPELVRLLHTEAKVL